MNNTKENFGEVIGLLAAEAESIRKLLNTPTCSTPYSGKYEGYYDLSKYLAKLDKAIEILSQERIEF